MKYTAEQKQDQIELLTEDSESKAWASLKGYKFWMFGYHAAVWVKYNQLIEKPLPNPFKELVKLAQGKYSSSNKGGLIKMTQNRNIIGEDYTPEPTCDGEVLACDGREAIMLEHSENGDVRLKRLLWTDDKRYHSKKGHWHSWYQVPIKLKERRIVADTIGK